MTDVLTVETTDGVATVTLNQPPVNALDRRLIAALRDAAALLAADPEVRSVVITGGAKVFAAGGDVKEMKDWEYAEARRMAPALGAACSAFAALEVPVIAAITGFCLGGGLELALAADIRIAADDARLGFPEILLGLVPGAGGTQRLPRLVGAGRAKTLLFTGRTLMAAEARDIGLVDEILPAAEVASRATELAAQLASGPTVALAALKQAIDRGVEVDLPTGLALEQALFAGLFATEDRQIGIASFLEHGPGKARFLGR